MNQKWFAITYWDTSWEKFGYSRCYSSEICYCESDSSEDTGQVQAVSQQEPQGQEAKSLGTQGKVLGDGQE